jgi:hypothetical protein
MKKFCLLLITICALSSCTSDSTSNNEPNPNLLQRVDFYPGTPNERRWIFNSDGLLDEITKADGTVIQDFTYDSDDRLTSSTLFNDSGINETHTFTYDNNDFVASVDGVSLNFSPSLNAYYTGDLNQYYEMTEINSEKLLVYSKKALIEEVEVGQFEESVWFKLIVSYTNNNILGFYPGEHCNYLTYDDKTNPLRNATLTICRAFSFVQESRWPSDYCISANNVLTHEYCSEDPESEVFHYTYNANDLPEEQVQDSFYLGTFESTRVSAKYYYQGDVLP